MIQLTQLKDALSDAIAEIEAYETKQSKAASARVRKLIGNVKNLVTPTRAALVAADRT